MAIFDINEASVHLGVDREKVRYLASHGKLPALDFRGKWYFSEETLEPYIGIFGGDAFPAAGGGDGIPAPPDAAPPPDGV